MSEKPAIDQYLIAICQLIIDEFNVLYADKSKDQLNNIANDKFTETDLVVRIGYPFKQMAHYTRGEGGNDKATKTNHDLVVESKDFMIEVKYLKTWGNSSAKNWGRYQEDFDWLFSEIDSDKKDNKKGKRAFVIGWFNCVEYFSKLLQLGKASGAKPIIKEEKVCYFPFLENVTANTLTSDLSIVYTEAYHSQPVKLIGNTNRDCECMFLGNKTDKFHFAIYY